MRDTQQAPLWHIPAGSESARRDGKDPLNPCRAKGSFPRSLFRKPPVRFRPRSPIRLRAHFGRCRAHCEIPKRDIRFTTLAMAPADCERPLSRLERHGEGEARLLFGRRDVHRPAMPLCDLVDDEEPEAEALLAAANGAPEEGLE